MVNVEHPIHNRGTLGYTAPSEHLPGSHAILAISTRHHSRGCPKLIHHLRGPLESLILPLVTVREDFIILWSHAQRDATRVTISLQDLLLFYPTFLPLISFQEILEEYQNLAEHHIRDLIWGTFCTVILLVNIISSCLWDFQYMF